MKKSFLIFLSLFAGLFHINVFAQTQTSIPISITVPTVLALQVTANSANSVTFSNTNPGPGPDLDHGITLTSATTLTYTANMAYFIQINSSTPNFTGGPTTGSPPIMPVSVVQYKLHSNSTYIPLSSTPTNLVGAMGSEVTRGTGTYVLDFFINPGYTYAPATATNPYVITIVYTISNK